MELPNPLVSDRSDCEHVCEQTRKKITEFSQSPASQKWLDYWEIHHGIPRRVMQQQLCNYLVAAIDFPKPKFQSRLDKSQRSLWRSIGEYVGFWAFTWIFTKKSRQRQHCQLLLDEIETTAEWERFAQVRKQFATVRGISPNDLGDTQIIQCHRFKGFAKGAWYRSFFKELRVGWRYHKELYRTSSIDVWGIALSFHRQILYYRTIFAQVKADYLLHERYYSTSAIRNHLFRSAGGKKTAVIQKNLIMGGYHGVFLDADEVLSFGHASAHRLNEVGSRVDKYTAVGSLFMQHYFHDLAATSEESKAIPEVDVLLIGINREGRQSLYEGYEDDFFSQFAWLARFASENTQLKVAIIHHPNHRPEQRELDLLMGAPVITIPQQLNSYLAAQKARVCVSFGSAMSYEILSLDIPSLLMNPGERNYNFLGQQSFNQPLVVTNYEEFSQRTLECIADPHTMPAINKDDFCLKSHETGRLIARALTEDANHYD